MYISLPFFFFNNHTIFLEQFQHNFLYVAFRTSRLFITLFPRRWPLQWNLGTISLILFIIFSLFSSRPQTSREKRGSLIHCPSHTCMRARTHTPQLVCVMCQKLVVRQQRHPDSLAPCTQIGKTKSHSLPFAAGSVDDPVRGRDQWLSDRWPGCNPGQGQVSGRCN